MTTAYDCVVIGGGQAGLAAAYHLQQIGARSLVLEQGAVIGETWAKRWDSLRLFTPARYNALPGLPFPGAPYLLPSKDEVARYLRTYVERFSLPVRFGTRVTRLTADAGHYRVRTSDDDFQSRSVVIATGAYHQPWIPEISRELAAPVYQCHSSQYRNPDGLPAGDVLVVGAGNSGAQIAMELAAAGRTVWLSGRDTGSIPRRFLGRDVYDWLWLTVMRVPRQSAIGRRLMDGRLALGDPLVGFTSRDVADRGVTRVGRIVGAVDGRPTTADGHVLDDVAAIVWCTGFRPDFSWIELPIFESSGYPRHHRGLAVDAPGLGFVGLRHQHTLGSSLLGGVGTDAEYVVRRLMAGTGSRAA